MTTIPRHAMTLAADLQPMIDFPEIYGHEDELAALQEVLYGIARAFGHRGIVEETEGEPF